MYQKAEKYEDGNSITYQIKKDGSMMTVAGFINELCTSPEFRGFYNTLLKEIPFRAYFWEHPAIQKEGLTFPYEFTIVDSDALANATEDMKSFEKYYNDVSVVSFSNLKGDARLVVPCPLNVETEYTHLGVFARTATTAQVDAFWQLVGEEVDRAIGDVPIWLSTSGLGVSWLHVRLDHVPKYYKTQTYK
jgi:hypothetical protein